jgi:tetracycline resistance efflux pump
MESIGWLGILPPFVAIGLALLTKDVFIALVLGVTTGGVLVAVSQHDNFLIGFSKIVNILADELASATHIRVVLFCVVLGGIVGLLARSGSTAAFGLAASRYIKRRSGVLGLTWLLGMLIFIDDYFSALSVGSVMKPIADSKRVSRAKLTYFVHSTAPTVCVMVPISSWVVTIMSLLAGSEGFASLNMSAMDFYVHIIPYNFYVIIALVLMVIVAVSRRDFGPMLQSERKAINENLLYNEQKYGPVPSHVEIHDEAVGAKWFDMIIPLLVLIASCFFAFPLTSYLANEGTTSLSFIDAIRQADSAYALAYGAVFSIVFIYIYFLLRGIFKIHMASEAMLDGMKSMMPAVVILALAWMMGHIMSESTADGGVGLPMYLSDVLGSRFPLWLLPVSVFLLSGFIAIATGTSWGTFGIMIPIIFPLALTLTKSHGLDADTQLSMLLMSMAAILSGAIFGDHCSPISDTTVLSCAGSGCPHLEHVATQMPYGLLGAASATVGFIVGGVSMMPMLGLAAGLATLIVVFFLISQPLTTQSES